MKIKKKYWKYKAKKIEIKLQKSGKINFVEENKK